MTQGWRLSWLSVICSSLLACGLQASPSPRQNDFATPSASTLTPTPVPVRYTVQTRTQSQVHLLTIPPGHPLTIAVAREVQQVEDFARETGAIAALNAGFFDPVNQQTTSFIVQDGKLVADPRQNDRLMQNPDLAAYLDRILNRSEFRIYRCGSAWRYAITPHTAAVPSDCQLQQAIGAGPQLLPEITALQEGFVDPNSGRDALGSEQPNARTAIGIKPDGTVIWLLVAQVATQTPSGMTLAEVAAVLRSLGATSALNLDGGSSSSLYYTGNPQTGKHSGKTVYGKLDRAGQPIQRPVKSALLLHSP